MDVGLKLHVVIREQIPKLRRPTAAAASSARLWFVGTVRTFAEFEALMQRFHVGSCVIDALPETRQAADFAHRNRGAHWAYYTAGPDGHRARAFEGGVRTVRLDRTQAIGEMVARFRKGTVALPQNARQLGGHVVAGLSAYYRELLAPQRTLEQDAHESWVAHWSEHCRPDQFAHSEVYCLAAGMTQPLRLEAT